MVKTQIDTEFWINTIEGKLQKAYDILQNTSKVNKFSPIIHGGVILTFIKNIWCSISYNYLHKRYLETGMDVFTFPNHEKKYSDVTVYQELLKDYKLELPDIPIGISIPTAIELICNKLDIPITRTVEGKWKTPYIPLSLKFYQIVAEDKVYIKTVNFNSGGNEKKDKKNDENDVKNPLNNVKEKEKKRVELIKMFNNP